MIVHTHQCRPETDAAQLAPGTTRQHGQHQRRDILAKRPAQRSRPNLPCKRTSHHQGLQTILELIDLHRLFTKTTISELCRGIIYTRALVSTQE